MNRLAAFGLFWWEFVVGDDWLSAVGSVLAIAATAVIAGTSVPAWWLMHVAASGTLYLTLRRALRAAADQR